MKDSNKKVSEMDQAADSAIAQQENNAQVSASEAQKPLDREADTDKDAMSAKTQAKELNGPKGLEPTRYGDWESKGRCYDF